jgi:hypothetical protein
MSADADYVPYRCGTLLIPDHKDAHLFVILTKACSRGQHLLANISTIHDEAKLRDRTCIIKAGEHRFVTHDSFVEYRFADVKIGAQITKLVKANYYRPHDDASDELTARIFSGVRKSDFTRNFVLDYLREVEKKR